MFKLYRRNFLKGSAAVTAMVGAGVGLKAAVPEQPTWESLINKLEAAKGRRGKRGLKKLLSDYEVELLGAYVVASNDIPKVMHAWGVIGYDVETMFAVHPYIEQKMYDYATEKLPGSDRFSALVKEEGFPCYMGKATWWNNDDFV